MSPDRLLCKQKHCISLHQLYSQAFLCFAFLSFLILLSLRQPRQGCRVSGLASSVCPAVSSEAVSPDACAEE